MADPSAPLRDDARQRSRWDGQRCARLGYLVGQGWDAKRIAGDPFIRSTPGAVQRQAQRLGLSLGAPPGVRMAMRLPVAVGAVYDRLARVHGLTRDAMLAYTVVTVAGDPETVEKLLRSA